MSADITVPALGESIVEATVGRWLKSEGDTIEQGEAVVELETDKVNMEVAAAASGVLTSILRAEGETVTIGDVLGTLDDSAPSDAGGGQAKSASPVTAPSAAEAPERSQGNGVPAGASVDTSADGDSGESARSTPLARRIASEHGVDINRVPGTGPSGRVTKEDVTAFVDASATPNAGRPPAPATTYAHGRVNPSRSIRPTTAHSRTSGCDMRTASTSSGETHCAPTRSMSSSRPRWV